MPMLKDIQLIAIDILQNDPELKSEKNKTLQQAVEQKFVAGVEM